MQEQTSVETVGTVGQGIRRDSALSMARLVWDIENPTTSSCYAG